MEAVDAQEQMKNVPAASPLHDIRPAYFYAVDAPSVDDLTSTPGSSRSMSASSDKKASSISSPPGIPVFHPTMAQFKDFYEFCQAIDSWGMQTGIVKIVPPREWVEALPSLRPEKGTPRSDYAQLDAVRIRHAITQHFLAAGPGRWKQTNVTRAKPYDAKQWADICMHPAHRAPPMSRIQRQVAAQRAAEAAHEQSRSYSATPSAHTGASNTLTLDLDTPGKLTRSGGLGRDTSAHSVRPASSNKVTTQDEWDTFDYEHGWLQEALTDSERQTGHRLSDQEWDVPTCRAIEAEYWRTLNLGTPPMYGADQQGTLFDKRTVHWNVGSLDSLLSRTLKCALPGVTTPYLYFGMWRASFAWHVEDMDLYSINYIHFGAPKQWYAIRQSDRQRFESIMAATFPADARKCSHFLRHKSFLVSPSFLASHGIKPLRLVQHAHEFVITYPYGYHSGYNLGYNCAESVNFALPSWVELGRRADYCRCELAQESVHIDVNALWPTDASSNAKTDSFTHDSMSASEPMAVERPADKKSHTRALHACVFCPRDAPQDPLVALPSYASDILRRQASSRKSLLACTAPYQAHKLCACFLPETWVATEPVSHVEGADAIDKSRWSLKCQVCTAPSDRMYGAKIQCTKGRCPRAVHVSCALDESSGWFLDICSRDVADKLEGTSRAQGDQPQSHDDDERVVLLCRAHNPLKRAQELERREEELRAKILALPRPTPVRVKINRAIWVTELLDVDETKQVVIVRDPANDARMQVPWTRLVSDEHMPLDSLHDDNNETRDYMDERVPKKRRMQYVRGIDQVAES